MTMKTIKVVEATELQLDWLVAYAQGRTPTLNMNSHGRVWHGWWLATGGEYERMPNYSNDWAHGGPILGRERITIRQWTGMPIIHAYMPHDGAPWGAGPTPLIAAMRCFCCSRLGREVEVPEELTCSPTPKNG